MKRLGLLIGLALTSALTAQTLAQDRPPGGNVGSSQTRIALVVGNGNYLHVAKLANSVADARKMETLFRDAGFTTVEARFDLPANAFRRALADFQLLANRADIAVIYYSGHGIEYRGQNYLVPTDAAVEREVDVQDEAVTLDRVLQAVEGAARLKLVILDACRTNPFPTLSHTRDVGRGLDKVEPGAVNELVAFAARAGTVALDGQNGGDSPYTVALLRHLMTPGLDVQMALRQVRDEVLRTTHQAQEPYIYGTMGGDSVPLVSLATMPARSLSARPAASAGPPSKAMMLTESLDNPGVIESLSGTVVWSADHLWEGGATLRGYVDIPGARIKLTVEIQKNTDTQIPASHTIALTFTVAPDSPVIRVEKVLVPDMRIDGQQFGNPIIGSPAAIAENSFLVSLTPGESEAKNLDLLRSRTWFEIPLRFGNGRIGKINLEKGSAGERSFVDVLQSWSSPGTGSEGGSVLPANP